MAACYGLLIFACVLLKVHGGPMYGNQLRFDAVGSLNEEVKNLLERLFIHENSLLEIPNALEVPGWPHALPRLGQVAGVAVDEQNRPIIFHRGPVTWNSGSFNGSQYFQLESQGPIPVDTVLTLDPARGGVIDSWGRNLFYLPHGIAVDQRQGDMWLTDVALHQVFKFRRGELKPAVILGERFIPGSDTDHFCQPTSVAVSSNGDAYIADGYCNSRILRFSSEGRLLDVLGQELGAFRFGLPHSVTLLESRDAICVADREEKRITCLRTGIRGGESGELIASFHDLRIGRVFGVASSGNLLYAVNGPSEGLATSGFTLDTLTGSVISAWAPGKGFHSPHAIAVSPDGSSLYVSEIGPNRVWKFNLEPRDGISVTLDK